MKPTQEIRESLFLLGVRIFLMIFLVDLIYSISLFYLADIPVDNLLHHHLTVGLLILQLLKGCLLLILILKAIPTWAHHVYSMNCEEKTLTEKEGIFNIRERVFDLKNIREINIEQGIFGKIFHFGNIVVTVSADGNYKEKIFLKRISEPEKYARLLKDCI